MRKSFILAGLICLTLGSCVDLEQDPQSFLTPENLIYDENNIRSTADGLYRDLWGGNYAYNCRSQILGVGADDIVTGMLSKRYTFIDEMIVTEALHDSDVSEMWKNMFNLIRSANTMIKAVTPSDLVSEDKKNQYLGEAYFMRAFAYYNLVRYFGEVPLFKDPTCTEDIFGRSGKSIGRAKIEDVYDLMIVPDLKVAERYLPNRGRTNDNSTVSKWAAKSVLADVYLTMAGWPLKRGHEYYSLSKNKSGEIIQQGGYSLMPAYSALWQEETKSSDTEHIFALNHSVDRNMASNYGRSYYALEESDAAWSDYLADSSFYTRYPVDDRKTFNYITSVRVGVRPINFTQWQMRSPAIAKYRSYGGVSSAQSKGITPITRYAEVLLMYAEAQNKADGHPNDSAYMAINMVRNRAKGGSGNDLTPGLSHDDFDKAVFDERGWEFFAEFKRWFHLVRTEKVWEANQFNPRVKNAIDQQGITKENRGIYLMPLPSKELQLTGWPQNLR